MASTVQLLRDTAAGWAALGVAPVPLAGEVCLETDARRFKVGDGVTPYASLPYFVSATAGDTGVAGAAAVALAAGQCVTRSFGLAAAATNAAPAIGLATAATTAGGAAVVRTAGPLQMADWTPATGAGLLQAGAPYFVSDVTPGMIQVAVPTTPGRVVQSVGRAVTTDTLLISVQSPILL